MKTTKLFAILLAALAATSSAEAITVDTVPVGNVGNANDPATGYSFAGIDYTLYGGVDYAYNIGKYEVTVGQYTAFLNAVAATDSYGLYNPSMATNLNIAGISQSGVSGSYSYSVIGSANHPVTYVSWGDAARFANWLHNNQPTGAQGLNTTEDGAYFLNGATSDNGLNAVVRKPGATWVIPSENEWYKAAYYQPAAQGGDASDYWAYPTRTNSAPYSAQPPGSGAPTQSNSANYYYNDDGIANGYNDGFAATGQPGSLYDSSQNYLTDVGAYTASIGPYGTFDQGGNVDEWNEAFVSDTYRVFRGGSWLSFLPNYLLSGARRIYSPTAETNAIGFRVATVPEPSTGVLAILASGMMRWRRKRFEYGAV